MRSINCCILTHHIRQEISTCLGFEFVAVEPKRKKKSWKPKIQKLPDFYWLSPREMLAFYWLLERVVKRLSIQVFTAVSGFYGYW